MKEVFFLSKIQTVFSDKFNKKIVKILFPFPIGQIFFEPINFSCFYDPFELPQIDRVGYFLPHCL